MIRIKIKSPIGIYITIPPEEMYLLVSAHIACQIFAWTLKPCLLIWLAIQKWRVQE
jgi:hypothetical protein